MFHLWLTASEISKTIYIHSVHTLMEKPLNMNLGLPLGAVMAGVCSHLSGFPSVKWAQFLPFQKLWEGEPQSKEFICFVLYWAAPWNCLTNDFPESPSCSGLRQTLPAALKSSEIGNSAAKPPSKCGRVCLPGRAST